MASTKLTTEDKQAAVALYQEAGQTATTVAQAYGVSVSTISRLLKAELSKEVYDDLVKQKRGGGETKSKKRTSSLKKTVSRRKQAGSTQVGSAAGEDTENSGSALASVAELEEGAETQISGRKRSPKPAVSRRRTASRSKAGPDDSPEDASEAAEASSVLASGARADRAPANMAPLEADSEDDDLTGQSLKSPPRLRRELDEAVEVGDRPRRRKRRRASAGSSLETDDLETNGVDADGDQSASARPTTASYRRANAANGDEPLGDIDGDLEDELALDSEPDGELDGELDGENGDDDDDAFDDAFDEDDLEDDDDDGSDNITALRRRPSGTDLVQVLPLEEANLSRMLYLVIDRTADLITMPMQHFSDLGQLPVEEEEKKTLPVFENHRVARRFSQRNQRVIKVPDGQLLLKTAAWLEAKGITRCLLDGQVYSLEADSEA